MQFSFYYKDENNIFDKFLGAWKYQNTNIELTVSILKNEHISMAMGNYESDEDFEEFKPVTLSNDDPSRGDACE